MLRLRIFASLLSILTLASALRLQGQGAAIAVVGALGFAAACLAVVAPFDAPDPPRRRFVLGACLLYAGAAALALMLTLGSGARGVSVVWEALLLLAGLALSVWAFATRNRRRSRGWNRYFEN